MNVLLKNNKAWEMNISANLKSKVVQEHKWFCPVLRVAYRSTPE